MKSIFDISILYYNIGNLNTGNGGLMTFAVNFGQISDNIT